MNIVYANVKTGIAKYASNFYSGCLPLHLENGVVHGITNNSLSELDWPKQSKGKEFLTKFVNKISPEFEIGQESEVLEALLVYMGNSESYDLEDDEDEDSGLFVKPGYYTDPDYITNCTVSSTALIITENAEGELCGTIIERTYDHSSTIDHEKVIEPLKAYDLDDSVYPHIISYAYEDKKLTF